MGIRKCNHLLLYVNVSSSLLVLKDEGFTCKDIDPTGKIIQLLMSDIQKVTLISFISLFLIQR